MDHLSIDSSLTAQDVIEYLGLEPLPHEGGFFRQTHDDENLSSIYFLMTPAGFSAMHRLSQTEISHHLAGAPAHLLLMHPDGHIEQPVIGPDLASGQRPQVIKRAGCWQGNRTLGEWTLFGTTIAPRWDWSYFEKGDRETLIRQWPSMADRIIELTRVE